MDLSIVIPVFNEEDNLKPLISEIEAALNSLSKRYEIVIIDDGSRDNTFGVLAEIYRVDPHLRVVKLKRNFGQTAALAAGLAHARGEVVVMLDGDGQNDPADIPTLLAKLEEGNDIVCGWRHRRRDPFLSRRVPSMIANSVISWTTQVKLHDYGCTLKAIRKEIAKNLKLYGEMHRFIPAIAYERGAKITEVKVNHRPRLRGKSKYGITRTVRVILDLVTVKFLMSYSTRPSHIFGIIGFGSGAVGFGLGIYLTIQKFMYNESIGSRPLLLLAVMLIFIGFQFVTMGLLGEMLSRTYHESQDKAVFVVGEILGDRSCL
jgi:glycosyltransferase involved in cell wall biosynthesis